MNVFAAFLHGLKNVYSAPRTQSTVMKCELILGAIHSVRDAAEAALPRIWNIARSS